MSLLLLLVQQPFAAGLRLMTYNIHAWRDSSHVDNLDRVIELIKKVDPDVLCLNEVLHPFVGPPSDDPYWSEVRQRRGHGLAPPGSLPDADAPEAYLNQLISATGLKYCAFVAASEAGCFFGAFPFGNAILSRFELGRVSSHILDVTPADLTLGGQSRTQKDLEPRAALAAVIELPDTKIGVCCSHLDHKAEELRERQMSEIISFCTATFGKGAHLICGDLNTFRRDDLSPTAWRNVCSYYELSGWPPPPEESLVLSLCAARGYVDAFTSWQLSPYNAEDARLPYAPLTCWSQKPLFRIDYVLLSAQAIGAAAAKSTRRWMVHKHQTLESPVSDHHPVVVDLETLWL